MPTPYQRSALESVDPRTLLDRFWPKVAVGNRSECWEWKAFRTPLGYGMFRVEGKMELAHRVSWLVHFGPFADTQHVLHRCDHPPCVNPHHLFLGDNAANVADKVAKGRSSFPQPTKQGERHHKAKLTQADVDVIRSEWVGSPGQGRQLAKRFGVSPATITNVLKHKVWRDRDGSDTGPRTKKAPSGHSGDGVRRQRDL